MKYLDHVKYVLYIYNKKQNIPVYKSVFLGFTHFSLLYTLTRIFSFIYT